MLRAIGLVGAVVLVSCGGTRTPSTDGSFGEFSAEPEVLVCGQVTSGVSRFAEGQTVLSNAGTRDVTIQSVSLIDPSNAQMLSVSTYDPAAAGLVGFSPGDIDALDPALVRTLAPVDPAKSIVKPGETVAVLVIIEAVDADAPSTYRRLQVLYTDGDQSAQYQSNASVRTQSTPCGS